MSEQKKLTKKDLFKSWIRWLTFSHSCYNYERLQGPGFAHAMGPIIKKLYDSKEDRAKALQRHLTFFNTEPNVGTMIHGITIAMEEERANGTPIEDEAINSVKTGLMGPLAGVGDTITQGTLTPILLAFGISLGVEGNLLGPILYTLMISTVIIGMSYIFWMRGYSVGKKAVTDILQGGLFNKVIAGAGILGCTVIGALTAQFVQLSTPVVLKAGQATVAMQAEVFDRIMPGLLPLLLTFGIYKLLDHKHSPMKIILYIAVLGTIGSLIGLF